MWQTPVRHDQRTGTSQTSASSRRLENFASHETLWPLRSDTRGPEPSPPSGGCGAACDGLTTAALVFPEFGRMVFVPEGQHDSSQARSAWEQNSLVQRDGMRSV